MYKITQAEKYLNSFYHDVRDLKILVVGETIIDEFISVTSEGSSMKSSCPALRLTGNVERQKGGASVIARHLSDFVKEVDLVTNLNNEIVKSRYVDDFSNNKFVEINKFDTSNFTAITVDSDEYDIVIVADFGHGFCDQLKMKDGFYLMCQTNSNNYGFNRISKWKNYWKSGICLDKREAALQINKSLGMITPDSASEVFNYELNTKSLFLTLGSDGSIFYDGYRMLSHGIIGSEVVDTIGAGDTFYAFSCLTHFLNYENPLFIPSLAASLSTTWRCNAEAVNKANLSEHARKSFRNI